MDDMSSSEARRPQSATFRLPAPALFFPVLLLFCVTPLATSGGAWAVTFVVPVLALVWVALTRTKATPAGVTAYGLLGAKKMLWTELAGLEFNDARWAIAVALDGRRVRLPMVRPRDLPRLVGVSGGSLRLGPDAPADEPPADDPPAVGAPADDQASDGAVADPAADDQPRIAPVAEPAADDPTDDDAVSDPPADDPITARLAAADPPAAEAVQEGGAPVEQHPAAAMPLARPVS